MVPWQTIKSLTIFLGPLLLPKAIGYYNSIRSRPAAKIKPLSQRASFALGILFLSGVLAFLSTLPIFHAENIYRATSSRLQTSVGVLFTRLSALHPLSASDEKLRKVLETNGLDARLLYVRFGPHVLAGCPFATPSDKDAGQMYLLYAAPSLLAPHLLHLIALGVATSRSLSGAEGSKWRTVATIAGLALGAAEFYCVANYDSLPNARSTRIGEVDFVHWKLHVYRGLAIAALDAVLGWMIWLQATGRAFLAPASTGDRIAVAAKGIESVVGKARGLGIIRNGVVRNVEMRHKVDGYWVKEGEVMKDVFEEPEVLEAQRSALRRLDLSRVAREAEVFLDGLFGNVRHIPPPEAVAPELEEGMPS